MYQYQFKTRNELEQFLREEIYTAAEARELLGIRQTLHSLIHQAKLNPIMQNDQVMIFWKSDVLHLKKELDKSAAE